jgi:hypothetical protein
LPRLKKREISEIMSGHGQHDTDTDSHGGPHDHVETSSDDFPADEPRSPGWLPLLGGALFLAGIFAFVVFGSDSEEAGKATKASAPPTSANAPPVRQPALRPGEPRPSLPMPPGHDQFMPRPTQ